MKDCEKTDYEQSSVWVRSENCREYLETWSKDWSKFFIAMEIILFVCAVVIICLLYWGGVSESVLVMGIGAVCLAVSFPMSIGQKRIKEIQDKYTIYTGYCSVEILIGEDDRIYGATCKGDFVLRMDQIGEIRFSPNTPEGNSKTYVPNDILTITDIAGNQFVFYSFRNCSELCTIINMRRKSYDHV